MFQVDHDEKLALCETMKNFGGSFTQALAECIIRADEENLRRLRMAFPEIFEKYGKEGVFQKKG